MKSFATPRMARHIRLTGCRMKSSTISGAGFSLAEAMMATVVVAIAASGVLLPFMTGARARVEGVRRTLASKLAGDLMEQIVNTPYEDVISTYDGYTELEGQVKDAEGVVFTDLSYAYFSRDISCANVYVPQESGTAEANFVLATVRVYYKGTLVVIMNRLISE